MTQAHSPEEPKSYLLYQWVVRNLLRPWILKRLASPERINKAKDHPIEKAAIPLSHEVPRIWFHAASAGELETLWGVIQVYASRPCEMVLTVMSESGDSALLKLATEIQAKGKANVLFSGFSPLEGDWKLALEHVRPQVFVTAKYEAWPDLWSSLSLLGIPLVIVGARDRRSFRVVRTMLRGFGIDEPAISFCTVTNEEVEALRKLFPEQEVTPTGDPRWDRVKERAIRGNLRAREVIARFSSCPKPWGILGSAWMEDLEVWKPYLDSFRTGTLWVVPHNVDSASVEAAQRFLVNRGLHVYRSSERRSIEEVKEEKSHGICILVDEMGFLLELYESADWAYVGGGFSKGVHSTIEPAIYGIPVAAGPKNASKFPEIEELLKSGQLELIEGTRDLGKWWTKLLRETLALDRKDPWKKAAEFRLGATARVCAKIESSLS